MKWYGLTMLVLGLLQGWLLGLGTQMCRERNRQRNTGADARKRLASLLNIPEDQLPAELDDHSQQTLSGHTYLRGDRRAAWPCRDGQEDRRDARSSQN